MQPDCNPDDPEEFAAWALVAMPAGPRDVPLLVHPTTLQVWSKHLHDCGFRHLPDLQRRWYTPPSGPAGETAWAATAGKWGDTPPPVDADGTVEDLVASMTPAQRDRLRHALDDTTDTKEQD
jgi:hypothetical protein